MTTILYPGHSAPDKVELLAEIFPEVSEDKLRRTLHSCEGDVDAAIQILLDQASSRGDRGENIKDSPVVSISA